MAAPLTKTKEERMRRRVRVSELYIEGRSMVEVGKMIGASHDTVFRDLRWCREQWHTRAADAIEEQKQAELSKIDYIESEAWRAWDHSIGEVKTVRSNKSPEGNVTESVETIVLQDGDPRYLDQILKCVDRRCKIMGLYAPVKGQVEVEAASHLMELVNQRRIKVGLDNRG